MRILFCLTFFYIFISGADSKLKCPSDTIQSELDNKICYSFVKESKNFSDAESFCNGRDGNLAVVPSQIVNNLLSLKSLEIFDTYKNYWIGGTIKTVKMNAASSINVWAWTKDDRLMTFSDWDPTTTSTGNCTGVQSNTFWSAMDCNSKNPFVCQISPKVNYCDEGWAYFHLTNSCFKKFTSEKLITQLTAENSCIQDGGHLASIHSSEENQFIAKLTAIGVKTGAAASVFWIGAQRNDSSSNWYWIDNTTFNYFNWSSFCTTNRCSDFWPDWTTDYDFIPLQWCAANCAFSLNGYLCKKSAYTVTID